MDFMNKQSSMSTNPNGIRQVMTAGGDEENVKIDDIYRISKT